MDFVGKLKSMENTPHLGEREDDRAREQTAQLIQREFPGWRDSFTVGALETARKEFGDAFPGQPHFENQFRFDSDEQRVGGTVSNAGSAGSLRVYFDIPRQLMTVHQSGPSGHEFVNTGQICYSRTEATICVRYAGQVYSNPSDLADVLMGHFFGAYMLQIVREDRTAK